jgi:hypothetical protein
LGAGLLSGRFARDRLTLRPSRLDAGKIRQSEALLLEQNNDSSVVQIEKSAWSPSRQGVADFSITTLGSPHLVLGDGARDHPFLLRAR